MSEQSYTVVQHAAESLSTGQFVAGLAILAFWALASKLMPHSQDAIDKALTLNRGRRASDRLRVVDGYQQVDADEQPLDVEWEFPKERAA